MKSRLFVVAFVFSTIVFALSIAFGIRPFGRSITEEWMAEIGLPENASYVGMPEIIDADGNQPEMLIQEVAVKGNREFFLGAFLRKCIGAGLKRPKPSELESDRTLVCVGPNGVGSPSVLLSFTCEGVTCRSFLEIYNIGI